MFVDRVVLSLSTVELTGQYCRQDIPFDLLMIGKVTTNTTNGTRTLMMNYFNNNTVADHSELFVTVKGLLTLRNLELNGAATTGRDRWLILKSPEKWGVRIRKKIGRRRFFCVLGVAFRGATWCRFPGWGGRKPGIGLS